MRLLIIRHADPDYSIDSLTETGWKEADLLSERLIHTPIDHFYVSPLGRAKDTASLTLKKLNKEATVCDWLQEFPAEIWRPDVKTGRKIPWDWLPQDLNTHPDLFDREKWKEVPELKEANVGKLYDDVCSQFDALLARHGYVRDGLIYRVERPNTETLAFFCHFGLESVLLSHLMNTSPYSLWHGFCAAPSSVSSIYSEERREGLALFRAGQLGDISHLYAKGADPSFSARFCECFSITEQRHD